MAILKRICCFGNETVFLVFPILTFIDCIFFGTFIHFLVSKIKCIDILRFFRTVIWFKRWYIDPLNATVGKLIFNKVIGTKPVTLQKRSCPTGLSEIF